MMKEGEKMKVLGTSFFPNYEVVNKLRELGGDKGLHGQLRVICKCKSMADANRKMDGLTSNTNVFKSKWCNETGNKLELELCENEDVWIRIDGVSSKDKYISKTELLNI